MKRTVLFALVFALSSRLFAQHTDAPPTIAPPPDMTSAESIPGALDYVNGLTSHPNSQVIGLFLTKDEISRSTSGHVALDHQYVLISRHTPSVIPQDDELAFQQLAHSLRQHVFKQQMTDAGASEKAEKIAIDEPDCVAKSMVANFTAGNGTVAMDMLMAYVRIDGKIVTIYASSRDDDESGKAWLHGPIMIWLRGLSSSSRTAPPSAPK